MDASSNAGRNAEFADLELMVGRLSAGIYEQARVVTADRGYGKTALLREFEEEQTEAGRWVVRAGAEALRRLAGITAGGVTLDTSPDPATERGAELERLLSSVSHLAREQGTVLLVLVDEAENIALEPLGELFYAIQEVQGQVVVSTDLDTGAHRRDALPSAHWSVRAVPTSTSTPLRPSWTPAAATRTSCTSTVSRPGMPVPEISSRGRLLRLTSP